jgi:hypothetical protein
VEHVSCPDLGVKGWISGGRMNRWYPAYDGHLALRVLWLYGLYMLISNAAFLIGYYLLREGIFRSGPLTAAGRVRQAWIHSGGSCC